MVNSIPPSCLPPFLGQSIRSGFCPILLCPEKSLRVSWPGSLPRQFLTHLPFYFFYQDYKHLWICPSFLDSKHSHVHRGHFFYPSFYLSWNVCNLLDFCKLAIKILLAGVGHRFSAPAIGTSAAGCWSRKQQEGGGRHCHHCHQCHHCHHCHFLRTLRGFVKVASLPLPPVPQRLHQLLMAILEGGV